MVVLLMRLMSMAISRNRHFSSIAHDSLRPIIDFSEHNLQEISRRLEKSPKFYIKDYSRAAVLVPLCYTRNSTLPDLVPSVLFELRSSSVGTHKGEVSFPGGKFDLNDNDLIGCALREMNEETGVEKEKVRVLGTMSDVLSINNLAVTPVIGFIGEIDENRLVINPAEIDHMFTLPLSHVLESSNMKLEDLSAKRGVLPSFNSSRKEHRVWGLSAVILHNFLNKILNANLPKPNQSRW